MLYDCVTHHEPDIKFQISLFIIHQYTIQYNDIVGSIADTNIRPLIVINRPHTQDIETESDIMVNFLVAFHRHTQSM